MKHRIFLIGLAVLGLVSCSKQMNYKEFTILDKDYITETFSNVGGFLTDMYNAIEYDFGNYSNGAMLASATDESEYSIMGNAIEDFYNGGWSAANPKQSTWNAMYTGIASANTFLREMQGLKFEELILNKDYKQQMYRYEHYPYETRALRAYMYFCLVRQYGDVPMVGENLTAEEINTLSRTPADDVFKFIISECADVQDKVIENFSDLGELALSSIETGRIDKLFVLAVKAQAALYWASPLFNPSNDKERWHNAATYYKELVAACDKRGMGLTAKFDDTWSYLNYSTPAITKEIVFARRVGSNHTVETNNYPVGIENGKGGNCPTQNLVDAFEMTNGKAINETGSGYDAADPYKGRDPRLALTVAVNGDKWPTVVGTALQTYTGGANGQPISGATTTGYYLKKLCHGAIDIRSNSKYQNDYHSYVIYRMGGIYLDYAEAVFQYLGGADKTSSEFPESASALASKTRTRVGMPAFPAGLTNDEFWTKYKNERMVELAFENHRFYDVRRWKEADKYFKSITRMEITKNADGSFKYTPKTVARQWNDKMYLFPIPQSEIQKNPNLTQNTGW